MTSPVNLAQYREEAARLRAELAQVDERRASIVRAIKSNDVVLAAASASEQPLLPIDGLQRASRRSTTRHGRAAGAKLNRRDRRVLRILAKGPLTFSELQVKSGVNKWTLRDSIDRLLVAGEVKRFGLARATRFVKASLKASQSDASILDFLVNR